MKNLQLSLNTKWFEMTKSGIKTEDYREITPYWASRLINYFGIQHNQKYWEERINNINENVFIKPVRYSKNNIINTPK